MEHAKNYYDNDMDYLESGHFHYQDTSKLPISESISTPAVSQYCDEITEDQNNLRSIPDYARFNYHIPLSNVSKQSRAIHVSTLRRDVELRKILLANKKGKCK
jgi:hypothetical protein